MTVLKKLQTIIANWLSTNSQGVFWLLVLFTMQLIVGRFYEAIGHWDTSAPMASATSIFQENLRLVLTALIGLSLFFKNNTFDLKLLIVLLFIPGNIAFQHLTYPFLEATVALSRWHHTLKRIAAVLIIISSLNHHVWLLYLCPLGGIETLLKPDDRYLASTTDNIYNLYKYTGYQYYSERGTTHSLYRVLNIAPGMRLVKLIDTCNAKGPVQVTRSKDGQYKIEGKELTRNE